MYYGLINSMNRGVGYTARTTAFATATGITDTTILGALNTFDLGLISNSLDTKMKAVYPMVGGTASTHKYNFMDARDLDVAFRLQFNGGWTHSSTGALPNGTNAYTNTYVTPTIHLLTDNIHTSYYSRSNITLSSNQILFDSFINTTATYQLYLESASNQIHHDAYSSTGGRISASITSTQGMYMGNRLSALKNSVHRNSSILASNTTSGGGGVNIPLFMAAANTGSGAVVFSKLETAFASIGSGLTDGEAVIFYNLVQAMQTTLSRQV